MKNRVNVWMDWPGKKGCRTMIKREELWDRVFEFRPIGVLSTPYRSKSGVPLQGAFDPESRGTAEVFEPYEDGLKDTEGFSHLILIYVFHLAAAMLLVSAVLTILLPLTSNRKPGDSTA